MGRIETAPGPDGIQRITNQNSFQEKSPAHLPAANVDMNDGLQESTEGLALRNLLLYIQGTANNDVILVEQKDNKVKVSLNGKISNYSIARQFVINTGGGNDLLKINGSNINIAQIIGGSGTLDLRNGWVMQYPGTNISVIQTSGILKMHNAGNVDQVIAPNNGNSIGNYGTINILNCSGSILNGFKGLGNRINSIIAQGALVIGNYSNIGLITGNPGTSSTYNYSGGHIDEIIFSGKGYQAINNEGSISRANIGPGSGYVRTGGAILNLHLGGNLYYGDHNQDVVESCPGAIYNLTGVGPEDQIIMDSRFCH
ncbi:MAG: hypothetical protein PHV30_02790 [Candidatus Margulisbacteria bacterium]|nr:hypothetical protein [Candidatus Margulisiibacteriota bacterium]